MFTVGMPQPGPLRCFFVLASGEEVFMVSDLSVFCRLRNKSLQRSLRYRLHHKPVGQKTPRPAMPLAIALSAGAVPQGCFGGHHGCGQMYVQGVGRWAVWFDCLGRAFAF